ncbi:interleukin-18 receptor accessory protein-like [Cheilinus undulatus]|uniref:interleukin-18 receptor accessory protein-like n=1 Tax=Cheilinus undulatus TaxID=241271 RepID=UPI001BD29235|nr:interleukin-18 receptor accessory protein-like [Cheilinus undulatus]
MQTECLLFFLIIPFFSEPCCVGNQQNTRKGLQQNKTHQRYKAVEGEIFVMPCVERINQLTEVVCSRTAEGNKEDKSQSLQCGREFLAEEKHSGEYTCLEGKLFFYLQVVKKNSLRCFDPEESSVLLLVPSGSKIACPGLNCSDNTDVTWYKGNKAMSKQWSQSCEKDGVLHLCSVREQHTGVYFCDRLVTEGGVKWTFRRAVNATAVPHYTPPYLPRITYPDTSTTQEVELGQAHTLTCEVYFPSEIKFSPKVQWFMHHSGNVENMTALNMEKPQIDKWNFQENKVTGRSIITEVTQQYLNNTFTCFARNSVGNSSVTIKLKKKVKVIWPSLVGYPIASLLFVGGLGVILHVKWLELQLIYRSRFQHNEVWVLFSHVQTEEKDFDVFLSFVWSDPSATTEGQGGGGCYSSLDFLNSEEGKVLHRPPEVLLPQVLEGRWGYRLCLLERDILPGGAYTNDVVHAIQGSRMLICLLSAEYLSNSDAVFVLESGVQALLQNSSPKLLLIWTNNATASLQQPDPPLPVLVQRALKVLPSLHWTTMDKTPRATSDFWKSLRKALPDLKERSRSGLMITNHH